MTLTCDVTGFTQRPLLAYVRQTDWPGVMRVDDGELEMNKANIPVWLRKLEIFVSNDDVSLVHLLSLIRDLTVVIPNTHLVPAGEPNNTTQTPDSL